MTPPHACSDEPYKTIQSKVVNLPKPEVPALKNVKILPPLLVKPNPKITSQILHALTRTKRNTEPKELNTDINKNNNYVANLQKYKNNNFDRNDNQKVNYNLNRNTNNRQLNNNFNRNLNNLNANPTNNLNNKLNGTLVSLPTVSTIDQVPEAITVYELSGTPPTNSPKNEPRKNFSPFQITSTDFKDDEEHYENEEDEQAEDLRENEDIQEDEEAEYQEDEKENVSAAVDEDDNENYEEKDDEKETYDDERERNQQYKNNREDDNEEINEENEDLEEQKDQENENLEEENEKENYDEEEVEEPEKENYNKQIEDKHIIYIKPIVVAEINYPSNIKYNQQNYDDVNEEVENINKNKDKTDEQNEAENIDPEQLEKFTRHFVEVDDTNEATEYVEEDNKKSPFKKLEAIKQPYIDVTTQKTYLNHPQIKEFIKGNNDEEEIQEDERYTDEEENENYEEDQNEENSSAKANNVSQLNEEELAKLQVNFEELHKYDPITIANDDEPEELNEEDDEYDKFRKSSKNDYLSIKKDDFSNAATPYEINLAKDFYKQLDELYDEIDGKYEEIDKTDKVDDKDNLEEDDKEDLEDDDKEDLEDDDKENLKNEENDNVDENERENLEEEEEVEGEQTGKSEIRLKNSLKKVRQVEDNVQIESDKYYVRKPTENKIPKKIAKAKILANLYENKLEKPNENNNQPNLIVNQNNEQHTEDTRQISDHLEKPEQNTEVYLEDRPAETVGETLEKILEKKNAISRHQNLAVDNKPTQYSNYWTLEYNLPH